MSHLEALPPIGENNYALPRYSYEQLLAFSAEITGLLRGWWLHRPELDGVGRHVSLVGSSDKKDRERPRRMEAPHSLEAHRADQLDTFGRYLKTAIGAASDLDSSMVFTAGSNEVPASRFVELPDTTVVTPTWGLGSGDRLALARSDGISYRDDLHSRLMLPTPSYYGYEMEMMYFGDDGRMVWMADLAKGLYEGGQISLESLNGKPEHLPPAA